MMERLQHSRLPKLLLWLDMNRRVPSALMMLLSAEAEGSLPGSPTEAGGPNVC
ncbi:hypothetical protein SMCF_512 [Streptomyces coelicoflavus ZG0656]|nr:hypothetical protein SMCF_512 [Streptomyces coelicoflavus ZG0656]